MAIFSFFGQTNSIFALGPVNNRKRSFQNLNWSTITCESSQFHEFGTNFIRGENRGWILGAKFNICASCDWNHMSTDWGKYFVCKSFCRKEYTFTTSLSMLAIQHLYQHLTSILILNDYLGPSSHCDRSGICKTYCLDLLWVYKNSSSLTSPKKSYRVLFLLFRPENKCQPDREISELFLPKKQLRMKKVPELVLL